MRCNWPNFSFPWWRTSSYVLILKQLSSQFLERFVSVAAESRHCTVSLTSEPQHVVGGGSSISRQIQPDSSVGCGTGSQPWSIEALAGQRIAVSLVDFSEGTQNALLQTYRIHQISHSLYTQRGTPSLYNLCCRRQLTCLRNYNLGLRKLTRGHITLYSRIYLT
jgi:hypothetical protein